MLIFCHCNFSTKIFEENFQMPTETEYPVNPSYTHDSITGNVLSLRSFLGSCLVLSLKLVSFGLFCVMMGKELHLPPIIQSFPDEAIEARIWTMAT